MWKTSFVFMQYNQREIAWKIAEEYFCNEWNACHCWINIQQDFFFVCQPSTFRQFVKTGRMLLLNFKLFTAERMNVMQWRNNAKSEEINIKYSRAIYTCFCCVKVEVDFHSLVNDSRIFHCKKMNIKINVE